MDAEALKQLRLRMLAKASVPAKDSSTVGAAEADVGRDASAAQKQLQEKFMLGLWWKAFKTRDLQRQRELARQQAPGDASGPGAAATLPPASQSWTAAQLTAASASQTAELVKEAGVSFVRGALEAVDVSECLGEVLERFAVLQQRLRDLGSEDIKTLELVCRNPGRFDVPFALGETEHPSLPPPARCLALRWHPAWAGAVRRLLGAAARCIRAGVVIAEPGAALQGMHRDGKQLFAAAELAAGGCALPCHCVTVFVPLVPLCGGEGGNGPTQFFPGTHHCPDSADPRVTLSAGGGVEFECDAGSCILFDYRIHHRGLQNSSSDRRPLLYFTFGRSWFQDATNYSSTASIFDD
jgi:hypothetical protein